MTVYDRLRELGLEMPEAPKPAGAYVPAKISRGFIFASGQTPTAEGKNVYEGKVGSAVSEEDVRRRASGSPELCGRTALRPWRPGPDPPDSKGHTEYVCIMVHYAKDDKA
jgi:hypothetical protein